MTHRTPSFVQLFRRARRLLGVALAAALTLLVVPLGQPAAHAITTISGGLAAPTTAPFGPQANLPQWYGDGTGLRLQPCQLATAPCLVIPGLAGGPAGFLSPDGEVFYWIAQGTLTTASHPLGGPCVATPCPTSSSLLVMGLEGAWVPAPGPDVFNRVRFRIGVPNAGAYTVTYPYGTKTFNVAVGTVGRDINDTTDSGAFTVGGAPANFAAAAGPCPATGCTQLGTGGPFEPFLTWDATVPAPPAGFISDGVSPHGVVGSPTGYAIKTNTCAAVAAGGTCSIGVTYTPAALAAAHTASLSIPGDPTGPLTVALSGATPAPVASLSATSVAFADTQMGSSSAAKTVTLTNTGNSPLHVTSVAVGGTNTADFVHQAGGTCVGTPIAPAGTCTESVTFVPQSAAARAATLTFSDDASPTLAASTQNVVLSGAGTAPPPPPPPPPPAPAPAPSPAPAPAPGPAQVPLPLPAPAPAPAPAPGVNPIAPRPLTAAGYWLAASDGGVFNFGDAGFYGSTGAIKLNKPIVTMASTPSRKGYWMVASDGGVFSFGDAGFHGSTGAISLNKPIVAMTSTPSGNGYWLIASDGGVFSFGDAAFHGSTGAIPLNRPIVAMASTPSGNGYWLIASDGGVFNFGDAAFHGSTGGLPLNRPIVAAAASPSGQGYWLVASDGGVFNFGDAAYRGSTGAIPLNKPIVTMAATPTGNGYWLVASDGGVFNFGDAGFHGSTGALSLNKPIIGMAA